MLLYNLKCMSALISLMSLNRMPPYRARTLQAERGKDKGGAPSAPGTVAAPARHRCHCCCRCYCCYCCYCCYLYTTAATDADATAATATAVVAAATEPETTLLPPSCLPGVVTTVSNGTSSSASLHRASTPSQAPRRRTCSSGPSPEMLASGLAHCRN